MTKTIKKTINSTSNVKASKLVLKFKDTTVENVLKVREKEKVLPPVVSDLMIEEMTGGGEEKNRRQAKRFFSKF